MPAGIFYLRKLVSMPCNLSFEESSGTIYPTFCRRIRPETKAVRHTFDAHIFDFSSQLLHGAHSPIDHLHACNGIVDSFRQKPKNCLLIQSHRRKLSTNFRQDHRNVSEFPFQLFVVGNTKDVWFRNIPKPGTVGTIWRRSMMFARCGPLQMR